MQLSALDSVKRKSAFSNSNVVILSIVLGYFLELVSRVRYQYSWQQQGFELLPASTLECQAISTLGDGQGARGGRCLWRGSCDAVLPSFVEHLRSLPVDEERGFLYSVSVIKLLFQGKFVLARIVFSHWLRKTYKNNQALSTEMFEGKISISRKVILRLILLVLNSLSHSTFTDHHLYLRCNKRGVREKNYIAIKKLIIYMYIYIYICKYMYIYTHTHNFWNSVEDIWCTHTI